MSRLETKRRTFSDRPGGRAWHQSPGGRSPGRRPGTPAGRDVIAELGVRSFINAAGTFTALTGLADAARSGGGDAGRLAQVSCRIDDLHDAVGKRIAKLLELPGRPGDLGLRLGALAGHGGLRRRQATLNGSAACRTPRA